MPPTAEPLQYYQFQSIGGWKTVSAQVAGEVPVELFVNGQSWLTFLCTASYVEALGIGFLFNEEIIASAADVLHVQVCRNGSLLDVWLRQSVPRPSHWQRTSGCSGGFSSAQAPTLSVARPIEPLSPAVILSGMEALYQSQETNRATRGMHCSMLADDAGTRLMVEDIGRHNTLDKLAGRVLLEKPNLKCRLVFTTGRVSSEMLQKSARLGACAVISRTSPTNRAIQLAERLGITLIGYARRDQFNVYTQVERFAAGPLSFPAPALSETAGGFG